MSAETPNHRQSEIPKSIVARRNPGAKVSDRLPERFHRRSVDYEAQGWVLMLSSPCGLVPSLIQLPEGQVPACVEEAGSRPGLRLEQSARGDASNDAENHPSILTTPFEPERVAVSSKWLLQDPDDAIEDPGRQIVQAEFAKSSFPGHGEGRLEQSTICRGVPCIYARIAYIGRWGKRSM